MLKEPIIKHVFFLGIGGIGMSALARHFLLQNLEVSGYDKTPSDLTTSLEQEGATVFFQDELNDHIKRFTKTDTLIVYTPAIPENSVLMAYFSQNGYNIQKRAEVLGAITRSSKGLCVAGTHGKSTTSAFLAFLMSKSPKGCNAFLGAIAANFESNFVNNPLAEHTVIEADEFDRSFLNLSPFASIITNIDPDHLDIYGTANKFYEGFKQYALKIDPSGILVCNEKITIESLCRQVSYALDSSSADYTLTNIRQKENGSIVDFRTPKGFFYDVFISIPGLHNAENALACVALLMELNFDPGLIIPSLSEFKGLKRRFELIFKGSEIVFIDDYAHHPTEINRLLTSVRGMFSNKKIVGIFQPHLYSRTRDFGDEFGRELSNLDELILMPIYPAREIPIQGISSDWLLSKVSLDKKSVMNVNDVLQKVKNLKNCVLLTIGAGDIDRLVLPIYEILKINDSPA